ncbi:MAG: GntR family transcriptional regulator YhfZ [Erysipelotrichaceae bacterium]
MKQKIKYQKVSYVTSKLAEELMNLSVGDKILPIDFYQKQFEVSRGTIQNAFNALKSCGAITLKSRGVLGSYIEKLDLETLNSFTVDNFIAGAMPLPYSRAYEGLATGIYECFKENDIPLSISYIRGSNNRAKLLVNNHLSFVVTSLAAAKDLIEQNDALEILLDFGPNSYLQSHVLVLANNDNLSSGMKLGVDNNSFDQQRISELLVEDIQNIEIVPVSANQTLLDIASGRIDAGVWNVDEIKERYNDKFNYVSVEDKVDLKEFTTAAIVVNGINRGINGILKRSIDINKIKMIQRKVKDGSMMPNY